MKLLSPKKNSFVFFFILTLLGITKVSAQGTSPQFVQGNDTLVVYKNVPTLSPSDKYTIRVRSAATNNEWVDVFANYTYNRGFELADIPRNDGSYLVTVIQGYQKHTNRWSQTFGNIEMNEGQAVEVEIAAKNGFTIGGQIFFKSTVHPAQKASLTNVVGGKIYFTITKPAQLVIDINGQMDDYNAAINGGIGHPIHAISLFANPILKKPDTNNSRVRLIETGTTLQTINNIDPSTYDTIYFKPGVHDIGSGIKMHPGKSIYIPGDALVYGTFDNKGVPKGTFSRSGADITFFGYGTISGKNIPHYQYTNAYPNITVTTDRVITIDDAVNYKLYGITTIDNANHTTSIFSYEPRGSIKWWKTITWRANGDGIGDYGDVEDCFIRTADDCSYVKGNRRRCTFWKDANAALFHMATIPENDTEPIIIEDCDFIYTRLRTAVAFNGGGFQQRGEGAAGQRSVNVIARNLRFHDKLINMPIFHLVSFTGSSSNPTQVGSSYNGILFQNISIAGMAPNNKQRILGCEAAPWQGGMIFDNLTIGGTLVTNENHTDFFTTNEFVKDIWYKMPNYYSITKNVNLAHGTVAIATTDISKFAIRTSDNAYLEQSTVNLTATALPGYKFSNWSGDVVSIANPVSVEMNSNKNITANFEYVGFKTLTVNTVANGTVVVSPTGTSHSFNTTPTLTAKPAIGYKFNGWSGDLNNQNIVTTILMDGDKTVTPIFVKTNDFAVNYGGDQYITADGTVYAQTSNGYTTNNTISNTVDSFLYQSERSGKTFSLDYPVDNGSYTVILKFAEIFHNALNKRVFNVAIEGTSVITNFDIFAETGGRYRAIDKTFQATVTDGNLNIGFTTITDNAKISAVQVIRKVIPTFTIVQQICSGENIVALPTTSTNGITGIWSPALNNIQTTQYTFTPTDGLRANSINTTITVNPKITPIFTPIAAICSGTVLNPLPSASINGISGTWSPALNNTQTTEYTFTPTAGLCASSTSMTITVNPKTTPTFTPVAAICSGTVLNELPAISTNGITGTWSPTLNNTQTTEYTFTPTVGLCASSASLTITVNPNIIPTFNSVAAICSNENLSELPTTSLNGITGTWSPALNNMQTTEYVFTPTAGLCASSTSMTITVNQCSQTFCSGAKVANLTPSGVDIKWYASETALTPLAITALLTSKIYYYTQTVGGVVSARKPEIVVINPTSIAGSIAGATGAICHNTGKTLTLSASSRGTIQWQSAPLLVSGVAGTFSDIVGERSSTLNTGNLTATTYFRAVVTNGVCPSKNTTAVKVSVRLQSVAGTISGTNLALCSGKNSTLMTLTGRVGRVQWHSSTDNFNYTSLYPLGITASFRAKNLASTTFYKAVVTNGTGCTSAISEASVLNVKPAINAGTISGAASILYNTRATLEVSGYEPESTILWKNSRISDGLYVNGVQPLINNSIYTTAKLVNNVYFKAMATKEGCSSFTEPFLVQVGTTRKFSTTIDPTLTDTFEVNAYPNPFVNAIKLDISSASKAAVSLKVYDLLGRLMEVRQIKSFEIDNQEFGNAYPSGTYNVIVTQGSNSKTLRVIKK